MHACIPWQVTPASSEWIQLWTPSGFLGQSMSLVSFPVQATLSRRMAPVPWPKKARTRAIAPVEPHSMHQMKRNSYSWSYYINSHLEMQTHIPDIMKTSHYKFTCLHESCIQLHMYLLIKIPALCRQPWHQMYSTGHHTQCPMHYCCRFPLDLHNCLYYLEVLCHH